MRIHHHTSRSAKRRSYSPLPARKPVDHVKTLPQLKKNRSRVVVITSKNSMNDFSKANMKNKRYSKFKKSHLSFRALPPKQTFNVCPNAPHNTTSFLMNFHRDEILNKIELDRSFSSDDGKEEFQEFNCYSYGSFLGSLGDSYEVISQVNAPQ
jgi:hypothetical protein